MMNTDSRNLALLLALCLKLAAGLNIGHGDLLEVESSDGASCTLGCTAEPKPGVQYMAVRWYKVEDSPQSRLLGLLTRDLPSGPTHRYAGLQRDVELLDESWDLLLPNLTCGDDGLYVCHLAAPVGEQNREGRILLTLTDCPTESPSDMRTDTLVLIAAALVLVFGLVTFFMSYGSLKSLLRVRNRTIKKETLLNAPLKPLDKKDLLLIYTLGPKVSKTPTMKHICV